MEIAIIGAGNVGAALGGRLTRKGHRIRYGVLRLCDAKTLMGAFSYRRSASESALLPGVAAARDQAATLSKLESHTKADCCKLIAES
jgi:predicted dinucleotide-binding enzyme